MLVPVAQLDHPVSGHAVALVAGELEVEDDRSALVGPARLPEVPVQDQLMRLLDWRIMHRPESSSSIAYKRGLFVFQLPDRISARIFSPEGPSKRYETGWTYG